MTSSVDPEADYGVWAWEGDLGDTVGDDTDLFAVEPANLSMARSVAVKAVFSGGTRNLFMKMGRTLSYTVQLVDARGNPVGPDPDGSQLFAVTIQKQQEATVDDHFH